MGGGGKNFGEKFLDEVTKPNKALYTQGVGCPFILKYKPINQLIIVFMILYYMYNINKT